MIIVWLLFEKVESSNDTELSVCPNFWLELYSEWMKRGGIFRQEVLWVWLKPCDWINGRRGKWEVTWEVSAVRRASHYIPTAVPEHYRYRAAHYSLFAERYCEKNSWQESLVHFCRAKQNKTPLRNQGSQLREVTVLLGWVISGEILHWIQFCLIFLFCIVFGSQFFFFFITLFNGRNKWMQHLTNI